MRHETIIAIFGTHMLAQMQANDYRNGGDGQYRPHKLDPVGIAAMMKELRHNVDELERVMYGEGQLEWAEEQRIATLASAADVANMAMLLAVDTGALRRPPMILDVPNEGHIIHEGEEKVCRKPPPGWRCTREVDHDGPCAAVEI